MSLVYKHIFKNIFAKPFRSLLLVFCVAVCALVAAISLDVTGNMEPLLKSMICQMLGNADMAVTDDVGMTEAFTLSNENEQLLIYDNTAAVVKKMDGEYAFYQKKEYLVRNVDFDLAYQMRLLPEQVELSNDETAISEKMAKELELQVGDTITLIDDGKKEYVFTIKQVLASKGLANGNRLALINEKQFRAIYPNGKANSIYINVKDDSKVSQTKEEIETIDPNVHTQVFMDSDENMETMKIFKMLFLLIFSICFFLVIFVTLSVSKRIVNERMSVIGTFRSLGMSTGFTTGMLILENACYGIIGSVLGLACYVLIREPLMMSLFEVETSTGLSVTMNIPAMKVANIIWIFLLGILVECACPLKEILVASKMSIRDIIFDNKDTAFRMSKTSKIIGVISFVIFVGTFLTMDKMECAFICFVCFIVAVSQLFPLVLKLVSNGLSKLFYKLNMPVAQLAANESYARKSTVGSSVLCVTAATLSIIIFSLLASLNAIYDIHTYDTDLIVELNDYTKSAPLSYVKNLEGVRGVEFVYLENREIQLNDKKVDAAVIGLDDEAYEQYIAVKNMPAKIGHDEFYIDTVLAKKNNIQIGDQVEVTFKSGSYIPMKKTMTCGGFVDTFDVNTTCDTIVVSKSQFIECYKDYVKNMLVKCDDPETVKKTIESYSAFYVYEIQTLQEYNDYWQSKKNGMKGMFTLIIVIGVGLTVIGMISNQVIGFEGRKRECAVLLSTALTRDGCAKLLFLESAIASGCGLVVAFISAMIVNIPISKLLYAFGLVAPMEFHAGFYLLFMLVLWFTFTLVSLFPIRALYKMKIAMQLKYE